MAKQVIKIKSDVLVVMAEIEFRIQECIRRKIVTMVRAIFSMRSIP
jgi:hypothetical protein